MNPIKIRSRLRVWRRWGSVVICASIVVQLATGWTETTFAVILCVVSVAAIWFGWRGLEHLLHHLRLCLAHHVATAMIIAYRKDEPSDERLYVPLVSFTTRAGEQRRLVPLTSRYEDPPTAGFSDRGPAETSHCHAPPIGHQVRVVYEPVDSTWADERISGPMLALSMIFHLVMIALFGALLIATVATQVPALRYA